MTLQVLTAQTMASPRPQFEVASIKRNTLTASNEPLRNLIRNAYGVIADLLSAGPDWVNSETYDIVAKTSVDPAKDGQTGQGIPIDRMWLMLQLLKRENRRANARLT
jgi:uncharacterized protein (TIGR03435 family)